jgi:hypothetical protein
MNRVERWLIRRKLERIQQDMQKGSAMKVSPAVKLVVVAVGVAALEALAGYLKGDATPTFPEAMHAVGAGAVGALLFWLRGPQATK